MMALGELALRWSGFAWHSLCRLLQACGCVAGQAVCVPGELEDVCDERTMLISLLVVWGWIGAVCCLRPPWWGSVLLGLGFVLAGGVCFSLVCWVEERLWRRRGGTCPAPVSSDFTVSEVGGDEAG